jgi:hypothetical protein
VDVESQLSILAGLAIYLLCLLASGFSVFEVAESVINAKIAIVLHLTHVDLLQFVEKLKVIINLKI